MKYPMTATLAVLLGTTLLPATAIGFEEVNTNPASPLDLNEESSDENEEPPVNDQITDADSTLTDNPEETDVTMPADDEDDVESSDSIENVDAGSPSGSDDELGAAAPMLGASSPMLGAGSPSGSDSENTVTMDTGNDIAQQATEDTGAIDPDPTVEKEDDEAVPGPGDMEEQLKEMKEEEGGFY